MRLGRRFAQFWAWILALGGIAAAIFFTVTGILAWQRGIYAGFHGVDALQNALIQIQDQYKVDPSELHYNYEDKTHLLGSAGPQVRIYYLTDPVDNTLYCASVWGGAQDAHAVAHRGNACKLLQEINRKTS